MSTTTENPRTSTDSRGRRRDPLRRAALVALASVSIAGCLAVPPVILTQRAFSEKEPSGDVLKQLQQESAPYQKRGTGTISGTVAMRAGADTVPAAAGTTVYLTPVTTYATARLQKYAIEDNEVPDRPHSQIAWITRADDAGQFHFKDLPPGTYYVISQMFWSPPADPAQPRGDVAYATVRLAPGEQASVFVTRPPPPAQ